MSKVKCPMQEKKNRPHEVSVLAMSTTGEHTFECSCGEMFTLTQKDIAKIYTAMVEESAKDEHERNKQITQR